MKENTKIFPTEPTWIIPPAILMDPDVIPTVNHPPFPPHTHKKKLTTRIGLI
jgi:hypothetical protein